MNKLFQTALMAALLVTSGSASESPNTIVGKMICEKGMSVDSGTTLSLADGAEVTLAKGTTMEVMGTLEGPTIGTAAIKCENGKATIDINTSQLETMESSDVTTLVNKGLGYSSEDMTYYHMKPLDEAGKIENRDNIRLTNVDVTENSLLGEVQSINDSNKTLVLADNSGSEPAQMTLKNPNSDAVEIKVNLANEGYDTPYTVTFTGPFYIYGDNTHFTQGIVNFDDSKTEFSGDNSAFQSEMNITNQSVVTYNKPVRLSKGVAVSNSKVVFKELVNLTNGAKLVIGGTLAPALTYVINFPKGEGGSQKYLYKLSDDSYYVFSMNPYLEESWLEFAKVDTDYYVRTNGTDALSSISLQALENYNFWNYSDYCTLNSQNWLTTGIIPNFDEFSINYSGLSKKSSDIQPIDGTRRKLYDQSNGNILEEYPNENRISYKDLYNLFVAIESGSVTRILLSYRFKFVKPEDIGSQLWSYKYYVYDTKGTPGINTVIFCKSSDTIADLQFTEATDINKDNKTIKCGPKAQTQVNNKIRALTLNLNDGYIDYTLLFSKKDCTEDVGEGHTLGITFKDLYTFIAGLANGEYDFEGEFRETY